MIVTLWALKLRLEPNTEPTPIHHSNVLEEVRTKNTPNLTQNSRAAAYMYIYIYIHIHYSLSLSLSLSPPLSLSLALSAWLPAAMRWRNTMQGWRAGILWETLVRKDRCLEYLETLKQLGVSRCTNTAPKPRKSRGSRRYSRVSGGSRVKCAYHREPCLPVPKNRREALTEKKSFKDGGRNRSTFLAWSVRHIDSEEMMQPPTSGHVWPR